jgi:signal transduction histidine kinase
MVPIRLTDFTSQLRVRLVSLRAPVEVFFGRVAGTLWALPVAVAAALAALWIADTGFEALDRSFADVSRAGAVVRATRDLRLALVDAETGQFGYTLTGDVRYLEPFTVATARLPEIRRRLGQLATGDRDERLLFREIEANLERMLTHWQITIDWVRKDDALRAQAVIQGGQGKAIVDQLREDIAKLERMHEARATRFNEIWGQSLAAVRVVLIVLLVLIVGLFLLLTRYAQGAVENERRQRTLVKRERDRLEQAVRERTLELSELAGHLQQVQERERFNLSRELHDEMGSLLTASKMAVAWVLRQGKELPAPVHEKLQKLDRLLEQGVQLGRRVIEGLAPSALSNLGLKAALEGLAEQLATAGGPRVSVIASGLPQEPAPETAIALYRVVQEALTNAQKHARATGAWVELDCGADWIELRVRDNGTGFDVVAGGGAKAHGLRGMRQRADSLGGTFAVTSVPGQGTTVRFRVPATPAIPA